MSLPSLTTHLGKPAIYYTARPGRTDPLVTSSWLGKVLVGRKREEWPCENGEPMIPVCQLNINELTYRPPALSDIAFLTVFVNAHTSPFEVTDKRGWLLRSYSSVEELTVIQIPAVRNGIKPVSLKAHYIENDFPTFYDCPAPYLEEFDISGQSRYPNQEGTKIGGWPSLIQSELFWGLHSEHPASPGYAFQLSIHFANLSENNKGVAYFGRGTRPGYENEWAFSWQQYG